MIWQLVICAGITWSGCGVFHSNNYPNEESCYRALREMKTGDQPVSESGLKRNTVAYCRPAQKGEK